MAQHRDERGNRDDLQEQIGRRLLEGWTFEQIEPMSTGEIFSTLNRLHIHVTPEQFHQDAARHESAERMADEWTDRYDLRPEGPYDGDFVWMAAIILWKRLLPDRICFEQIDDQMQEGYALLEAGRLTEACDAWWQTWEWLKDKVTPERNTIDALDKDLRGTQLVFSWCQDFEMELGNAGLEDPHYLRLCIRYCREFVETFADLDPLLRGQFLRAEAEAYWRLGDVGTAEIKFEALIQENPDEPWGYVAWSDLYWLYERSPKDYDRGEAILQCALARPQLEERDAVLERLAQLRAERGDAPSESPKRRKR